MEAAFCKLPRYHTQVEEAFKQFDTDKSGQVSFAEFRKAVERFGLSVAQGGAVGGGGVPAEVLQGLFDRCDTAASKPHLNRDPSLKLDPSPSPSASTNPNPSPNPSTNPNPNPN